MARLRLSLTICYIIMNIAGLVLILGVTTGALGHLLSLLATITGVSFVLTGAYGLQTQRTLHEHSGHMKAILAIGVVALIAFGTLMTLVVIALRNFT